MKRAQLIVLGVAAAAGGGAFWLMSAPAPQPEQQAVAPPPPPPTNDEVLVASHELPMGTLVAEGDLAWQVWPKGAVGAGMILKADNEKVIEDIKGSVSRAAFFQGEPMRREKLVKGPNSGFMSAILPSGMRAVAINIDATGSTSAGGFILPNDRVDVIRTYRDDSPKPVGERTGDAFVSETLLRNVRVLAIGQNVQEKNGERVVVGSNATLELDPAQSELIILNQRVGQLSLTLRSMLDAAKVETVAKEVTSAKAGMTIVRYGVSTEQKK